MKENYTYAVVIKEEEDCYDLRFPAFDNYSTVVDKEEDIIKYAQDVISFKIMDLEDLHKDIPDDVKVIPEDDERIIYLNLWMPYQRAKVKETYVKKTLTIPTWLDMLAKSEKLNFSAILTNALKKELKIDDQEA